MMRVERSGGPPGSPPPPEFPPVPVELSLVLSGSCPVEPPEPPCDPPPVALDSAPPFDGVEEHPLSIAVVALAAMIIHAAIAARILILLIDQLPKSPWSLRAF